MNLLTVVKAKGFPIILNEKCLWSVAGYYVGATTGKQYAASEHYHCPQYAAVIRAADAQNTTGMLHLNQGYESDTEPQENRRDWKAQYIGCQVTVEEAHYANDKKVYRCLELREYFSEDELEILSPPHLKNAA